MGASVANSTRTVTITLPEDVTQMIEQMCTEENVDMLEILQRAFRSLQIDRMHRSLEAGRPQASRDEIDQLEQRQMDEVNAVIKQLRRQDEQERRTA